MASPPKPPAISANRLVQQANLLSNSHLERLIELLSLLQEAKQFPPIKAGQSERTEAGNYQRGNARIELKYIPDSRGSEAVYGPYKYLRFAQGKKYRSLYLGKEGRDQSHNDTD